MSLEKKRRAVGAMERAFTAALLSDPFVALDDKLIRSGLIPKQGDPLTGGWGATGQEPSILRIRAEQVAELAEAGLAQVRAFRFGKVDADEALTTMTELLEAMTDPFDGFDVISKADLGAEPHGDVRDRRWTFDGETLTCEVKIAGKWHVEARYSPNALLLGVRPTMLDALGKYERAMSDRLAQTEKLDALLAKAKKAWNEHPAVTVSKEYLIAPDSPAAAELREATSALTRAVDVLTDWNRGTDIEKTGWRRSPKQRMFETGPSFNEAQAAIQRSVTELSAKVSASRLDIGGSGKLTAPPARGKGRELATYSEDSHLDAILGDIGRLYAGHPIRRRFDAILASASAGAIPIADAEGLDEQIQALEDLDLSATMIAHEYTEGRLDYGAALERLDAIRNELAAIDGSYDPSTAREPADRICAKVMAAPREFAEFEPDPIRIDDNRALPALASIEGDDWLEVQKGAKREPTGFFANRDAWIVLRDLGKEGQGLSLGDLLDGAGTITGQDGRLYDVRPDGRIALLSTSTDDQVAEMAGRFGLLVT